MKEFIMTNLNTMTAYGEYEKKNIKMYKKSKANLLKEELDNIEKIIDIYILIEFLHSYT
ncbi:hypothetical protein [Romboutsia sp.]|uniref:hypothetical protein n=1 Tax=Romboutsia sp. TaxID=1965302 RepID=UPI003F2ED8BD